MSVETSLDLELYKKKKKRHIVVSTGRSIGSRAHGLEVVTTYSILLQTVSNVVAINVLSVVSDIILYQTV